LARGNEHVGPAAVWDWRRNKAEESGIFALVLPDASHHHYSKAQLLRVHRIPELSIHTETKPKSSWVTCKIHDMYNDSILCQVPETFPVTRIQVLEQLGCVYFQGHIGVYPQEILNSFGAFSTGGSR